MVIKVSVRDPEKLDKHFRTTYGKSLKRKLTEVNRKFLDKAEHERQLHAYIGRVINREAAKK
jgi:hypothetical protein